jgi:hypothetical protein
MSARIARAWRGLPPDRQRLAMIVIGGVTLTLVVYITTSGIVALVVAAVVAYFVGRTAHRPRPSQSVETPSQSVERPRTAQRRVRPAPQTPIGRLFAERPAWSGPSVDPFEPPAPAPRRAREAEEPYDSR